MLDVREKQDAFVTQFEQFESDVLSGRGDWLRPLREAAIARFAELGFPTTRNEDWHFTNVASLAKTRFEINGAADAKVTRGQVAPFSIADCNGATAVFVNGWFSRELSTLDDVPVRVTVRSLADAIETEAEGVEPHLGRYAEFEKDAFAALNTAFMRDGAFVHVGRGVVCEQPIHLLYVWTASERPTAAFPRNLIVAEINSQVTIIETHAGLGDGVRFTNAVTEIVANDQAVVDHYRVERESESTYHVSGLRIQQDRNSNVRSHAISLGGALLRNNIHAILDGEGGECTLNGLTMIRGTQHVDHFLRVEHAKPHCRSWEYFKNVLDDKSRTVFTGRIFVHPDAQKTDAKQTNMNLILSDEAIANSKPQLEIFADDVKCTHGATIGQVDKDAIFYLRSRGIGMEAARSLLVYAFASESLGEVRVPGLRQQLEELVFARLGDGHLIRGSI